MKMFDRLMKAEWLENIETNPTTVQKGVTEQALLFRKSETPTERGAFKIHQFSKLYRELLLAGPISQKEIEEIVNMGRALGIQWGIEKI